MAEPQTRPIPAILLLAAGNASRFGSAKQLAHIGGMSMVRRAAQAALDTGAGVCVVTGAYSAVVEQELEGLSITLLHNAGWADGMGSSIACGARHAAERGVSGLLIALADQPLVGTVQLRRLLDAHATRPAAIIAADHGDTLGPPVLFPARYLDELARLSGPSGARGLLKQHAAEVLAIPMPEAATDIDDRQDFARFLAHQTPL